MIQFLFTDQPSIGTALQTLIIDDDPVSREALLKIVRLIGLPANAAVSVAEGLRALDPPPHNIVLDLMLPDGTGIDILREIRRRGLPVRVALLTGADQPLIAQAQALRPDAVFVKPVDLRPLIDWLKAA
jgi:two-component system, OmpR family, response regulator QseB